MTLDVDNKDLADIFGDIEPDAAGEPVDHRRPGRRRETVTAGTTMAATEAVATPGWRAGPRSTTCATAGR